MQQSSWIYHRLEERRNRMAMNRLCSFVLALLLISGMTAIAQDVAKGGDVVHAVAGVVTKVDSAAKTITLKTVDGTEHVFKYTEKTTVHAAEEGGKGAKAGAVDTYMAGKEGSHAVIHYTGKGADETAVHVEDMGKRSMEVSHGTVTQVDKAARTVTIKAEDGTESTYHVAKDATVDTEHGVTKNSELVAKKGEQATVHYTDEAGKKIVHFFKHI
jgi:Cu/Ag efflux protein CusF